MKKRIENGLKRKQVKKKYYEHTSGQINRGVENESARQN